jgi:hypothetical protein
MPNQLLQFVCTLGLMVGLAMSGSAQEPSAQKPASQGTATDSNKPSSTTKSSGSEPASSTKELHSPAKKPRKRPPAVVHSDQNKIVVPEGGAKEPPAQIAPGLAPEEAIRDRREAEQWLTATDGQLKELATRQLSEPRQEVVTQVRNYQIEARAALKENDLRRAHTLALKAHLLADDMVKH